MSDSKYVTMNLALIESALKLSLPAYASMEDICKAHEAKKVRDLGLTADASMEEIAEAERKVKIYDLGLPEDAGWSRIWEAQDDRESALKKLASLVFRRTALGTRFESSLTTGLLKG